MAAPILAYHQASKHEVDRYAPGPGQLDWRNQPQPFRHFAGCARLDLPLGADALAPSFASIRAGQRPTPQALGRESLAALLELSFGLSAWKEYQGSRWALRCNPSSGNLHPTECYILSAAHHDLPGGVFHYLSRDHVLEARAVPSNSDWGASLTQGFVVGLSGIHWREAWKYGLRAFRYCQHDCGHALAAVAYAAATLGWRVSPLFGWSDDDLAGVLGLDRAGDFSPSESEVAEFALWVGPGAAPAELSAAALRSDLDFHGTANRLSSEHRSWSGIDAVDAASRRPRYAPVAHLGTILPPLLPITGEIPAARLIRQRRSAVDFDGQTRLPDGRWFAMLDALLPRLAVPPHVVLPGMARVHPVFFVHRITGVEPGIYVLLRAPDIMPRLRAALRQSWEWTRVAGAPQHLALFRLGTGDVCDTARDIACHQDIAADSCFAVGMLADFDAALRDGPWHYRQLFWECGVLGQILYLEAEAAGIAGTGIGCFFDDAMHRLLGITDTSWQSLYHFTVGGPVNDPRLQMLPPYDHLGRVGARQ